MIHDYRSMLTSQAKQDYKNIDEYEDDDDGKDDDNSGQTRLRQSLGNA